MHYTAIPAQQMSVKTMGGAHTIDRMPESEIHPVLLDPTVT